MSNPTTETCVLFALARESQTFRQLFTSRRVVAHVPCHAWLCSGPHLGSILLAHTGIGAENTRRAMHWLLNQPCLPQGAFCPRLIIMAGYAGGLHERLNIGDVLVARDVADTAGNVWPTTWPTSLPKFPWAPSLHHGRLLSSPRLVATPEDKRQLASEYDAHAVDMETAVVASLCTEHHIPFGAVRAISDDVHTPISPRLINLISAGKVSIPRVLIALLRSPLLLKELLALQNHTRQASENLGKVLDGLLTRQVV